jgi:hypothetical protein
VDLALVHTCVAHGSGRCFRSWLDGGSAGFRWRCKSLSNRASRAIGDLVDVASCENVAEVAATRLDDDVGRTLEVKEELCSVSEVHHVEADLHLPCHPRWSSVPMFSE